MKQSVILALFLSAFGCSAAFAQVEDPMTATMLTEHPAYIASFGSALPQIPLADPDDISDAVVWLASDLSRTVTGTQLTLDMGATKV